MLILMTDLNLACRNVWWRCD